jgi:2-oxoglutarate ferredoxin oxidoreductase subunit delta
MPKIEIDRERCKGCLLCAHFCPKKIISASEQLNAKGYYPARLDDEEKCIGCASCARMCPDVAIVVYK